MLPLSVNIFERGAAGIPGTTYIPVLSPLLSYTHTISCRYGFETMRVSYVMTKEDALVWLTRGLGRSVVVASPGAMTVWEGRLIQIDATFGPEKRSVFLNDMANRVRVRYTTVLDTPGAAPSTSTFYEDSASQTLYGKKDAILSVGKSDSTEAGYYGTVELVRRKNPHMAPITEIATGDQGGVQVDLTFEGWYGALGWVTTSNTSTTKTATTTQLTTLLTNYNSVNNFFSTVSTGITASGINVTEFIPLDTTYQAKIEDLLKRGNGTNPYAWGVYEDRKFFASVWAGASPTTIDYRRHLGDSNLYNIGGAIVPPWSARPDTMFQTVDLLDVGAVSTAQDAAARFYVARVGFAIDEAGYRLSLEPDDPQDLAIILIRKYPSDGR